MRRTASKIILAVFLVLLFGLAAVNLATPARGFSEMENRPLAELPVFSWSALLDGDFTAGFDAFVTDQFAFRDAWVGVKTELEKAIGRASSGGVYFAEDGYLIEMFDSVDPERFRQNIDFVKGFSERVEGELQIPVRTVLVPTASMILADKLPANAPETDQRALLAEAGGALPGLVDVSGALAGHSEEYIYYRTDHHWTSLGAYYGYAEWRRQTGREPRPLDGFAESILSDSFYGTTYSKAGLYSTPADTITALEAAGAGAVSVDYGDAVSDSIYERAFLEEKDKYSVFLSSNRPIVRIKTGITNGEKLLVIKDSFANCFTQLLLADYEEIVVIDLRFYHEPAFDLIRDEGLTEALVLYNMKGFSGDTNLYYLSE